jgi:glycosyltransferase involved in cell wall biosynthesis
MSARAAEVMGILHLLAPAGVGGMETVVRALAAGLAHRGHRVGVAGILDTPAEEHPFKVALEGSEAEFHPLYLPGRRYLAERRAVAGLLEDLRPGVLHTHGYRPDVVDSPIARRMGIGTVTTVHGFVSHGWRNRVYEWLQWRAFRRFDVVVPVSERLGRQLAEGGVRRDRMRVIRNAWIPARQALDPGEARAALGLPGEPFTVGWVGRFTPEKGVEVLLEAFALLGIPEARLSLIGGGPEEPALRSLAGHLKVEDRVHWHGVVPEARNLLAAFDVLALTSWSEGTPMVLLEAMAAGTPIVTTKVGGIEDMVSAKEAVLVPPGEPRVVAEALRSVLLQPELAEERAESARRRLENEFSMGPWLDQYEEVYQSVGRVSRQNL